MSVPCPMCDPVDHQCWITEEQDYVDCPFCGATGEVADPVMCDRCSRKPATHYSHTTIGSSSALYIVRSCCLCHVRSGGEPVSWHPACVKEARLLKRREARKSKPA